MRQRTLDELLEDYYSFIKFLKKNNFKVEKEKHEGRPDRGYYISNFYDINLKGGIVIYPEAGDFQNWRYAGRIYADNINCFDKYPKCPFQMMLPSNKKFQIYLNMMRYWGTKKGYTESVKYEYQKFMVDI